MKISLLTIPIIPLWVFSGLNIEETKTIKGTLVNRMLLIADKQRIQVGKYNGTVYGDGKAIKADSIPEVFKEINPYELRVRVRTENGKVIDQLLLKMRCLGGTGTFGFEGKAVVNFIGDLDGDDKNDILITYQKSFKEWHYGLFSTRYATDDRIFKELTIGRGSE